MRKAIISTIAINVIAVVAFAQTPPVPPAAPVAPVAPVAPAAPKPPKAPKAPKAPMAPEGWGNGSYLGVDSRDVTPESVSRLKLKSDQGVELLTVDQDAPAGKAGLKEHDVIVSFNGKPVQGVDQLRRMIRDTAAGTKVNLGISRDGKPMSVTTELADRRKTWVMGEHVIRIPRIEIPPMPEIDVPSFTMLQYSRRNGLMVENITKQLGEYFGAKEGRGVLVRGVEKNSPAEAAGFRAGDVIVRVGSEQVENMGDWNQVMRQQQAGKVPVTVIREKHEQTFTLTMPERRGDRSQTGANGFGDLDDMGVEIAGIGPEIQKEMEQLNKQFNSEEFRKQMRDAQREYNRTYVVNQKEIQKQVEKAQREMQRAMREMQKQNFNIHINVDDDHDDE